MELAKPITNYAENGIILLKPIPTTYDFAFRFVKSLIPAKACTSQKIHHRK